MKVTNMNWNYRLLDRSHRNGGESWLEIVEAYYDGDKLIGFVEPNVNGETKKEVISNLQRIIDDIRDAKVLKIADFGLTEKQDVDME